MVAQRTCGVLVTSPPDSSLSSSKMAKTLLLNTCLLLLLSQVEACSMRGSRLLVVPGGVEVGRTITRVEVADCDPGSVQLSVEDPSFEVHANGDVVAVKPVSVTAEGRTFYVRAVDGRGSRAQMEVHLRRGSVDVRQSKRTDLLKRTKRRWSPPPFNILENEKGPFPREIERIVSDSEAKYDVYYTITGPGYNEYPVGLFQLDSKTGMLSVTGPVDREQFPAFVLTTRVFDVKTGIETDLPLPIHIVVDDMNDNAPEFQGSMQLSVDEQTRAGTVVGKINATDKDKPGTEHVKIKYTLLSGLDLFAINPSTGVITTVTNTLDRETQDKYLVTVKLQDNNGAVNGNPTTGTVTISVGDINDNPPTFKQASFKADVKENEKDKLILRIPVDDKDLIKTPSWNSKFVISKGNENGNFRIDRDPATNEGLLYAVKPLNFEKTPTVKLEVTAQNEVPLVGTNAKWNTAPVEVSVGDIDEGPEFTAPTVRFTVKENTANGTLIGSYTAVDPETKTSDGIKYYKTSDPGGWVTVDRNNGELRVANTIDRESKFVKDGLYPITMKAVDASSKTGTGTVILVVEDVNDNVPVVPPGALVLCEKEGELGSVLVVAEDLDNSPHSDPFSFSLPKDHDGKWSLTRSNGTSAILQQTKELPVGIYHVPVEIADLQGSFKEQKVKVRICQCRNGKCLNKPFSTSLGPMGWLALLLPLLLLLLLFLLLAFFCSTKGDKLSLHDVGGTGGNLLKSNIEAPGEEVDLSLIQAPTAPEMDTSTKVGGLPQFTGQKSSSTIGMHDGAGFYTTKTDVRDFYASNYESQYNNQQYSANQLNTLNRGMMQDSAFLHTWQTNGRYLHGKLGYLGTEEDGRYADDIIHSYGYEGNGSRAGSVGCCSDFAENDNLDFLNTLGPKFKTLASVSKKS
ncbi:desmocollin 2-like protein [Synchiropus picturatus]